MASTSPSSSPTCIALCSAASAVIAGEAESVGVFASRISSPPASDLSLARSARASSRTSSDARSALAWMASTRVSSRPWEGHGPFIALRTAASASDCILGSIPLRTPASASADFTLWPAASKCSESAPADGWLKKGRAQRAAASNISKTNTLFMATWTFLQWEFIFVRHYVRMWFTSCIIVFQTGGRKKTRIQSDTSLVVLLLS